MSGGWAGSDRRQRLPDDWDELCRLVDARAGGRCERIIRPKRGGFFRCGAPGTDHDHVIPGDDHRLSNLELLCSKHHDQKSSQEGNAAKAAKKALSIREQPQHPGFIRRK